MAYNPQTQYRGDVYLSRGIEDAGRGLAGAIQNFRRDKAESDFLDEQVVGLAAAAKPFVESGELDPSLVEDLSKFPGQSLAKKRGIAARALFEVQNARQMRQEKRETEDLNLRRGMEHGRLQLEAARFNQRSAELARARAGQEQFNVGLSEYMDTPETLRRPLSEVAPGIAARAGVATPEMVGRWDDDARLREAYGLRERAVAVQEGNLRVRQVAEEKKRKLTAAETKTLTELKNKRDLAAAALEDAESEVTRGNVRAGPDWAWGGKFATRADEERKRLEVINRRIAEIEGEPEGGETGGADRAAAGARPAQAPPANAKDPELEAAMQAIQRGADPAAVEQRYRQRTGKALPW